MPGRERRCLVTRCQAFRSATWLRGLRKFKTSSSFSPLCLVGLLFSETLNKFLFSHVLKRLNLDYIESHWEHRRRDECESTEALYAHH